MALPTYIARERRDAVPGATTVLSHMGSAVIGVMEARARKHGLDRRAATPGKPPVPCIAVFCLFGFRSGGAPGASAIRIHE